MKRIPALVAWLAIAAAPRAPAGSGGRDGEVRAVSVPASASVDVVIDLRGAVDVQDFTLPSPARLVLDLQGARLAAPAVLYDGQNRGGIKNIRYAQFRPDVVRIVIDLDVLKSYQIEKRDGQVRVQIGSERTAFAAWTSQNAAAAAALAAAPAPSRRGGEAARVATPAPGEAARAINQYLSAHADEASSPRPRASR